MKDFSSFGVGGWQGQLSIGQSGWQQKDLGDGWNQNGWQLKDVGWKDQGWQPKDLGWKQHGWQQNGWQLPKHDDHAYHTHPISIGAHIEVSKPIAVPVVKNIGEY